MRLIRLICVALMMLPGPVRAGDVAVFAAASLAGPLDQIAAAWADATGQTTTISYAGSSALARQVEAGAPVDLVILASEDWMDVLEVGDAILPATRRILLTNRLVLIGTGSAPLTLEDLPRALGRDRLALALTDAVPAGIYARGALETLGLWDAVAPQVVEADNVRAALRLVAIGAARYGIVYATDAVQEPRVSVLAEIPASSHPPIRYPMALTPGAGEAARTFADYLAGPAARAILSGAGFGLPPP